MVPVHTVAGSISSWLTYSLIVASLLLSPADAAEPERVSIQKLLSPQATSYQQQLVTIEGVVRAFQAEPPFPSRCLLYGRATFVLEGEAGSLPVETLGSCNPGSGEALPKEQDRVRITGVVHVRKTEPPRDVRILSTQIQILESH
jgi:hypothetical protein